jgi:hypothetical protein
MNSGKMETDVSGTQNLPSGTEMKHTAPRNEKKFVQFFFKMNTIH